MPLLTPRRYPAAVTVDQARAAGDVLSYYLGSAGLGNGDPEMTERLREVAAILSDVQAEDEKLQRRRDAIREAVKAAYHAAFREILKLNPRLASRDARPLAVKEVATQWPQR